MNPERDSAELPVRLQFSNMFGHRGAWKSGREEARRVVDSIDVDLVDEAGPT
jgi:hypothetical protein